MGYRSDVTIAFYSRDNANLPGAMLKLWFDENYPHKEAEGWDAKITRGSDYVLIQYYAVKWYSGYLHVDAVNRAIHNFEDAFDTSEEHTAAAYELIRIGEDHGDLVAERSDYADYHVGVRREIITSFEGGSR